MATTSGPKIPFPSSNSSVNNYTIYAFTTSGTFTPAFTGTVEVLVIAGGGGGGMDMGGGGGGGGFISNTTYSVTSGVPVTIVVGAGGYGAPGANLYRADGTGPQPGGHYYTISATAGSNSVFGSLTAIGGGYGGSSYFGYTPNNGQGGNGGSGGGSSGYSDGTTSGKNGTGTSGQGYNGGQTSGQYYSGGGGGGGAAGASGPARADGGNGYFSAILGRGYYWGGGGGGAGYSLSSGGWGGLGGGGGGALRNSSGGGFALNPGEPGGGGGPGMWANCPGGNGGQSTGGGGGGGSHYNATNSGGNGGSGIVIVRHLKSAGSSTASINAQPDTANNLISVLDPGNPKCITTNYFFELGNSSPSNTSVTFPTNGTGTFTRLGYGQTIGGYTIDPNDVVYQYVLGTNGCHYHGFEGFYAPAGQYLTFSFDFYVSPDATNYETLGVNALLAQITGNSPFNINITTPNVLKGRWQRVSTTLGPSTSGNFNFYLYPGGCNNTTLANAGYILFKNPIAELTNVDRQNYNKGKNVYQINDLSGYNSNARSANNSIGINQINISVNQLVFNGSSDYVNCGNYGSFPSQGTVEFWMNPSSVANYQNPFHSQFQGGNAGLRFEMTAAGAFYAVMGNDAQSISIGYYYGSSGLTANTWYHVVFTWDTTTNVMSGYLNNVAMFSNQSNSYWPSTLPSVTLGNGLSSSAERWFSGKIGLFKMYNKALTANEISQEYHAYKGRFGL